MTCQASTSLRSFPRWWPQPARPHPETRHEQLTTEASNHTRTHSTAIRGREGSNHPRTESTGIRGREGSNHLPTQSTGMRGRLLERSNHPQTQSTVTRGREGSNHPQTRSPHLGFSAQLCHAALCSMVKRNIETDDRKSNEQKNGGAEKCSRI
jgi:hypothetical protein